MAIPSPSVLRGHFLHSGPCPLQPGLSHGSSCPSIEQKALAIPKGSSSFGPLTSPPAVRHALPPPTNLGWLLAHLWAPGKGQAWQLCLCPTGHGHRPGWRRLPSVQTPTCLDVEAPRTSVGSSSHELIKYNHLLFLSCKILQGLTWIFSPKWEF